MPRPHRRSPTPEGRFGAFGGQYVPEVLVPALDEAPARGSSRSMNFRGELDAYLTDYVGRPSPLTFAPRLSERPGTACG